MIRRHGVVLSVVLSLFSSLFGGEDEVNTQWLDTYQQKVRAQPSGVYQVESNLYVHVRMPAKPRDLRTKLKLCADLKADDMLRKWAIEYTSARRVKADGIASGLVVAAEVLDSAGLRWRFPDWKVQYSGQEFSGKDDEGFYLGRVINENDLIKQIPSVYYRAMPDEDFVVDSLLHHIMMMHKKHSERLYADCGVVDLCEMKLTNRTISVECDAIDKKVGLYFDSSAYVSNVRNRKLALLGNNANVHLCNVEGECDVTQTIDVKLSTNLVNNAIVVTNSVIRAETALERENIGVSASGKVNEEILTSDDAVIIETKTVSTVTTKKTIRRKVVKSIRGNPRFEEIFLSGGVATNAPMAQIASGVEAAKLYCSADATLEAREKATHDALCENPGDIQMWNMYGRCLMKRGDNVGALICFRAAAKLDRNDQYMLTNLAEAYEILGCHRLACGYAILGIGLSKNDWCLKKCKEVLLK